MIPDDVRRFVLTSIPSVPYLEALLLFHREPASERTALELARYLYIPEATAESLLNGMCSAGILARGDVPAARFRYAPHDPGVDAMIGRLAAAYASDMIELTHVIHDSTNRSAQRFADAFKLRKEH